MKRFLSLMAALAVCCTPANTPKDLRTPAERAEDRSVVLFLDDDAICTGVWISPKRILTAAHCVKNLGKPEALTELDELLSVLEMDTAWDPVGRELKYADKVGIRTGGRYTASVTSLDESSELALLAVEDPPTHDWAHLAPGVLRDGEEVDIVGMPARHWFTYVHGWVSSTRESAGEIGDFKAYQVSAPAFFGNSGGGAFDAKGDLVGISSFIECFEDKGCPNLAFFVHRDVIAAFLRSRGE